MRILALDPGSKRIGIAISDELMLIAQPLEYVPATPFDGVVTRLQTIVKEKGVELLLVGMPINMNGTEGQAAARVREFIDALANEIRLPIKTWDERLTSAQANRLLIEGNIRRRDRKQKVDKMAAAILLQSYLDSLHPP